MVKMGKLSTGLWSKWERSTGLWSKWDNCQNGEMVNGIMVKMGNGQIRIAVNARRGMHRAPHGSASAQFLRFCASVHVSLCLSMRPQACSTFARIVRFLVCGRQWSGGGQAARPTAQRRTGAAQRRENTGSRREGREEGRQMRVERRAKGRGADNVCKII